MGFFSTRERSELNKVSEVEGEIREFVRRRDVREAPNPEPGQVADRLSNLVSRVAGQSIQEIDNVTAGLLALRERLQHQEERIRHDVLEYATLSQSTMQSSKIIFESLAQWRNTLAPASPESEGENESPSLAPTTNPDGESTSQG